MPVRAPIFLPIAALLVPIVAFAGSDRYGPLPELTCPLRPHSTQPAHAAAPHLPAALAQCLVGPEALDRPGAKPLDVRPRSRFEAFHVPRARSVSVTELETLPYDHGRPLLVYEAGRFRSDALLLCSRLQRVGFRDVRVIDGGIAAWAQKHASSPLQDLGRLDDTEVAAMLREPGVRVTAMETDLRTAAPVPPPATPGETTRRLFLAGSNDALPAIARALPGRGAGFFWIGTPERLRSLLQTQLSMDAKRRAGAAHRSTCSAL